MRMGMEMGLGLGLGLGLGMGLVGLAVGGWDLVGAARG
jgi:hypothetical protein